MSVKVEKLFVTAPNPLSAQMNLTEAVQSLGWQTETRLLPAQVRYYINGMNQLSPPEVMTRINALGSFSTILMRDLVKLAGKNSWEKAILNEALAEVTRFFQILNISRKISGLAQLDLSSLATR